MNDRLVSLEELPSLHHYSTSELRAELRKRSRLDDPHRLPVRILLWPFRAIRRWWRWVTPQGLKKFARLCTGAFLVVSVLTVFTNRGILSELQEQNAQRAKVSQTNSEILRNVLRTDKAIEEATSPEARAAQTELLRQVVNLIDCNDQRQVQRLADELKKLDIPPGDVTIQLIEVRCVDVDLTPN